MSAYTKAQRAAYIETVYEDIKNNQGSKINSVGKRTNLGDSTAYYCIRELMNEGRVIRMGRSRVTRYYTSDYDRTTHNEFDHIPIVNKTANKKKNTTIPPFSPNPDTMIGKAASGIPDNVWMEASEEPESELTPAKETETVPEEQPTVDYDRIAEAILTFRPYEDLEGVVFVLMRLQTKLLHAVGKCPFCGGDARLERSSGGEYRIECSCGFRFANVKHVKSATETIKAFNRRAVA